MNLEGARCKDGRRVGADGTRCSATETVATSCCSADSSHVSPTFVSEPDSTCASAAATTGDAAAIAARFVTTSRPAAIACCALSTAYWLAVGFSGWAASIEVVGRSAAWGEKQQRLQRSCCAMASWQLMLPAMQQTPKLHAGELSACLSLWL